MGARPLRRAIQRYIEDPLADFVLRAELTPGATVMVEPAPEDDDRDVILTVVQPDKVPAASAAATPTRPSRTRPTRCGRRPETLTSSAPARRST